ncbi:MAG TPA: bifunctional diguanylate cyclase/phosphodiesterase [Conexibacter sp.]|nr:bifunctional diguanylate cyclase/phosphodiesterase [Conexibacter sp.]
MFSIRVALALAASVVCLLLVSDTFFAHAISRELVEQDAHSYEADARALEQAYDEGSDPEDALDDVLDLVDSMKDRLGVLSARLIDADGHVVSGPRDFALQGDRVPNPKFKATLPDRGSFAGGTQTERSGDRLEFVVPLVLAGDRYALDIKQTTRELDAQVGALRNETLLFSLLALLLGMGLFYVIGGRSLARRHRTVVQRATRDPLTDLGNHRTFQEELAEAVADAVRRRESLALALVDLDDFKFVNDRHGHRRGDEVLSGMARVLEHGRPADRAFRIGGDEFALLMPGADGERARTGVGRRLVATRDGDATSSFTAGIAVLADGSDGDPAVLWEQADAALYEGKRVGGGGIVVFDDVAELISIVTPAKILALRSLLEEPRLETAFQPIWQLEDSHLLGLEALSRPWSGYGFDGPAEMFAVAEKIGRAHELDAICRSAALARAHELPEGALLFLNINPQSLAHDTLRGDQLVRAVKAAGLDPEQVVLEITERSDARLDQVVADATRLRSLGFGLALDDVGAGNAGLEMLRELPVDYVKIDQSVIVAALGDTQARAVLVAIIAYARRADAFVIAEGIESEDILTFVRTVDSHDIMRDPPIDGGQGFLLGRPSLDPAQIAPLPRAQIER